MPTLDLECLLTREPGLVQLARALHGGVVKRESFLLPKLWMLHFYDYAGEVRIGEARFRLQPGSATLAPAGREVEFTYEGPSRHLFVHFSLSGARQAEAMFWAPDARVEALRQQLEGALHFRETDARRASVRLWDVLLGLAGLKRHPEHASADEQVLAAAIRHLENDLAERLRIAEVARRCGVSINTLGRVFQRRLGCTPVGYLRRCRVQRALDLLQHSDLPVKAVAAAVGLPDLHHFNKVVRRATARNPRAWREGA